jgi:hypothetical protein
MAKLKLFSILILSFFATSVFTHAAEIIVPGKACPWLAGATNGTPGTSGDLAPDESPVVFTNFTGGISLYFIATGSAGFQVGNESGPEGIPGYFVSDAALNGIGAVNNVLANELLGVFLNDSVPDPNSATPAPLDFGPGNLQDFEQLAPALNQPFAIGNGFASNGIRRAITVPMGATRLFLGICDGSGWYNNPGSFTVTISQSGAPAIWIVPAGASVELHWPSAYTNCVVQVNTNLATTNWVTVTNASGIVGSDLVVTNSTKSTPEFFRLLCH